MKERKKGGFLMKHRVVSVTSTKHVLSVQILLC